MLTHIVCWKYKEETSQEQREDHATKLKNLPNFIENIESFEVGFDILNLERSFDLGLVAIFPDQKALDAYAVHPEHQKVASLGKTVAKQVVSVDFIN